MIKENCLDKIIESDSGISALNRGIYGLVCMYTGPMGPPGGFGGPGGPGSPDGFGPKDPRDMYGPSLENGSPGNLFEDLNLGEITGDSSLSQYGLRERYDLSGHDGSLPHLNQSVVDYSQQNIFGQAKDLFSGGISGKNEDGYKGLGLSHMTDLFGKDKKW